MGLNTIESFIRAAFLWIEVLMRGPAITCIVRGFVGN